MAVQRTNLQDRYELREVLGRGATGVVCKSYDRMMGREVALKTILAIDHPATAELYYQQWSILDILVHPNVMSILDFGEFDHEGMKKPFYAMPLLNGTTLGRLMQGGSGLSIERVVEIVRQAALGLQAAHDQGVVHQDLKPSNIFVAADGSAKVFDFGVLHLAGGSPYLAPELLQGSAPTALSDQFALAAVAREALAAQAGEAVSQVIRKAMAPQPAERFAGIREFAEALHSARNESEKPAAAAPHGQVRQAVEAARKLLDAGEYAAAMQGAQDALDLDPNDADALALRAKVEQARRERRVADLIAAAKKNVDAKTGERDALSPAAGDNKTRLYQSAQQAWGKGEAVTALAKLEELMKLEQEHPEEDAERGNTYRNFYNQVHSESEILEYAYQNARRDLAEGNTDGALAICKQYLAKYPNHAPFRALQAEVEARQKQRLAQTVAETNRKMEEEGDLERRVAMLEEARQKYPGEALFERALQMARDKRELVNSIVSKASFYEDRGQLDDALDQLQILRSIHEKQPGLADEIQRMTERRNLQAHLNSQIKWITPAKKYIAAGDYQRAQQAVLSGLAEFPGDPELTALGEEVRRRQEGGVQALELLGKAREASDKGAHEEGLAALREAYRLDPRNTVIRTVMVNGLVEHARRAVDSNPAAADSLVKEALAIDPNNLQAQIVAGRINELQNAQTFAGPLPVEWRSPTVETPPIVQAPPPPLPPPAPAPVSQDQTLGMLLPPALESLPGPPKPKILTPTGQTGATPLPPMEAPAPKPAAPPRPPAEGRKLLVGTAIAAGLLVLIGVGYTVARHKAKPVVPVAAKYSVALHSTPEGAEIKINGESCGHTTCTADLAPGNYTAEAQLTGYQTASVPFAVGAGSPHDVNLALSPQAPRVSIFTDLTSGTVSLDSALAGQIQDGGAEVPNLAPGKHVLEVKGGDSTASISVEIAPGAAPALSAPIDAKNVRAFLVAGFGPDAKVYGSATGYRVTLDGKLVGPLVADGVPLGGLTPGTHELALDSDAGQHDRMVFESQPSATLYVSLGASQNLGMLTVETNEDQAHVIINGQQYRRDTTRGRLVVYLAPRKYTIAVLKDGFAPAPEQSVEIKRGVESKLSFTMSPAKSILAVHHAPPGTDVQVDNISRGSTHPDGEFQVGGIEPGHHTVTLHHDGFKPLQVDETFAGGKTLDVQGNMEAMPVTGTLRFDINPAGLDAHVHIRKDGDAQDREVTGASVSLPEGHYTVSVSAPQYVTGSAAVQVAAGGTAVASIALKHVEAPKAPPKVVTGPLFGLEDWLKQPGWTQQGGMLVHGGKGGEWLMATPDLTQGAIRFTVVSLKGKHVEWVVAERDQKNYIYYELDDKNVTRYEVKDGAKQIQIKVAHGLDRKKPIGIMITVTPHSSVISVNRDGWLDLDKWDTIGSTVHGRFGFRITGSDEIGLQDFSITPN